MFLVKAVYCRMVQKVFRAAMPFLPYREPKLLHSCKELCSVLEREQVKSVLLVTDQGIVKNGLIRPLEEVLKKQGVAYTVYDKTQPNPTVENVEEARKLYLEKHCEGLLVVGGGSSMDCAKAVGARIVYPKRTLGSMKGILRVWRKLPTLIAVPTTAGTGSEATLAAVITDPGTRRKYALMSFPLIPHYAVLDPSLTYSLPAHLTASTGMDALTHAIEAYIGRSATKETRKLALEAVRLIFGPCAVSETRSGEETQDRKVRSGEEAQDRKARSGEEAQNREEVRSGEEAQNREEARSGEEVQSREEVQSGEELRSRKAQSREEAKSGNEAVKKVRTIEAACIDGRNRRARERMLLAAYKAGIAFSKSYVGYIHALAHALGGTYGTPHGLANAVLMPYVLESYGASVYKSLHEIGTAAGVCKKEDSDENGAKAMIAEIRRLNKSMGLPDKLAGIRREDIPRMAAHAEKEANPLYPVPKLLTAKELEQFYHEVADWSGEKGRNGK